MEAIKSALFLLVQLCDFIISCSKLFSVIIYKPVSQKNHTSHTKPSVTMA